MEVIKTQTWRDVTVPETKIPMYGNTVAGQQILLMWLDQAGVYVSSSSAQARPVKSQQRQKSRLDKCERFSAGLLDPSSFCLSQQVEKFLRPYHVLGSGLEALVVVGTGLQPPLPDAVLYGSVNSCNCTKWEDHCSLTAHFSEEITGTGPGSFAWSPFHP